MLGSEYNWLISFTRTEDGPPRVRLASGAWLTLAIAVFCFLCVALRAEADQRSLQREAAAALQTGDTTLAIAKLEAARALRPDYPHVLLSLARAYAAAGRAADAIDQLRELAAIGLDLRIAADPALAPLRARADFQALVAGFAANHAARGAARDESAWTIPAATGIIEGLAINPDTQEAFFGDVHNRCIWCRAAGDPSAGLRKFSRDTDGLLGVFALKLDPGSNTLWASSSAVPEMSGYAAADRGRSLLAAYDLSTRALRHTYALPADGRDHVLGDFTFGTDHSIYVTDSLAPVIWRLAPGGAALEKWFESGEFVSLQGLALSDDRRSLCVADYASGLWRIPLDVPAATRLPAPAHTTLLGIDGLYAVAGGLVGVQNGVSPQRIVRIALDAVGRPTAGTILAAGLPAMTDLALGQILEGRLAFVGNSGWALFDDPKTTPASRAVNILSTQVD